MEKRASSNGRSFVSVFALCTSLGAYYLAKSTKKDTTPFVMIGGFVGAILGEIILEAHQQQQPQKQLRIHKQLKK
jgi:hypothetical protein